MLAHRAVALAALLSLAGCVTSLPRQPIVAAPTGDAVTDDTAQLALAPARDRVLWEYRIAAAALRKDDFTDAQVQLDAALPLIGGILTGTADAARARSLFHAESEKTFIGEPYERVMAYYYRGIIYWRDGQIDNARACFRSAAIAASHTVGDQDYPCTWVLPDNLSSLATDRLAGRRSQGNVLVFAEFGRGPVKFAAGRYGEQLHFAVQDSPAHAARLLVAGRVISLPARDDLNIQATTRGGRVMDYILNNKAVFKATTNAVGNVALTGGAVANDIYDSSGQKNQAAEDTAAVLDVIGLASKIVSNATVPRADTRTWDNLPQYLSFAACPLPAGDLPATLQFLDANGRVLPDLTRQLVLHVENPARDTVVFLSELTR